MTPLAAPCQADMANMPTDLSYEALLSFADLVSRTVRNRLVSPVYRLLYLSLIDTYPDVLSGEKVAIQVWRIRENAGWPAKESATKFFQDLASIGAIVYDPGKFNKNEEDRVGFVTANTDVFPYPEKFDIKSVERRRKAREEEAKRRKQFRDPRKLEQCEECGSEEIFWDATPYCQACGHVHRTIKDIPGKDIVIEAEIIEAVDNFTFLDEQATSKRPAIRPGAVQISLPVTPAPAPAAPVLGKHPRGIACPDCGGSNHWYPVARAYSDEPLWNCGICLSPEEWEKL